MSILIKNGMKLPKSCWDCEFEVPTIDHHEACILTGKSYNWGLPHRPSECPLSEVPTPHGRLIDADNLLNTAFKLVDEETFRAFRQLVIDSTTIIPEETEPPKGES